MHNINKTPPVLGFIGSGNMASAMVSGLIQHGYPAHHIWLSNPSPEPLRKLAVQFNVQTTQDNNLVAQKSDILILAIKPIVLPEVIKSLVSTLQNKKILLISIAAGIETSTILSWLQNPEQALIRAMPNMPALISAGITGLYTPQTLSDQDLYITETIFNSIGIFHWLEAEEQLDIITALSGSGPGFLFYILNAMVTTAHTLGLPLDIARKFALETMQGTAKLALHETTLSLQTLQDQVTSKGGTTEAGLNIAKAHHLDQLIQDIITAATLRAKTLRKNND